MGKTSTLIYLYSNFDENNTVYNVELFNDVELKGLFRFIKKNTKKVPDKVVQNVIEFAKNYS